MLTLIADGAGSTFPGGCAVQAEGVAVVDVGGYKKASVPEAPVMHEAVTKDGAMQDGQMVGPESTCDSYSVDEKIDIVLAAFDDNGDGHLNFDEFNAVHQAACGGQRSLEFFVQMCADEGEEAELGLGKQALMRFYSQSNVLEKDFAAARAKLEGAAGATRRQHERELRPINLMLKNPSLAVPFAIDATERLRQKASSSLMRKR